MKKLFVLLLLIPIFSFGQIKFKDLMKIDSQEAFEKLMFDEQFSNTEKPDGLDGVYYSLNPTTEDGEILSSHFATYTRVIDTFWFSFTRTGTSTNLYTGAVTNAGVMANNYDTILKKVKRKCEFVKMYKVMENNFACYECKDAEFKGYLGFAIVNGLGTISNFNYID